MKYNFILMSSHRDAVKCWWMMFDPTFHQKGFHFFMFGWEWDIGLFYFRKWR